MLNSYFKIAWRNLFRNKLHTGINIGGLVIGFTIGIAILLVVYGQLTYDNFHVNGKRLYQAYQVYNKAEGEEVANELGLPAGPTYKSEVPAIERTSRYLAGDNHVEYNGRDLAIPVTMADEDFTYMFSLPVVKGNHATPLKNRTDVIVSEDAAKRIFGNDDPIGKTIRASIGGKLQALTVSAVVRDIPGSSINFDLLTRIDNMPEANDPKSGWENRSHFVFVELKEGFTQRQAELQLKEVDKKHMAKTYTDLAKKGAKPDKYGDIFATRLLPVRDMHLSTRVNGHKAVSPVQIITLLAVGLLIILIACFNFVNINLANAFARSKEIGVRKCLGAARSRLVAQLWVESFLVCTIAFVLSLVLVNVFLHTINGMEKLKVSVSFIIWKPGFLLCSLGLLLFVSLIAGGYPSWMMAGFRVVESLKGKLSLKRKSGLRSSLIVMQFVIACIMISCTVVVYRQFRYLQSADLGINKDYVISVPIADAAKGREIIGKLRTRLAGNPNIVSISGSNINLGRGMDHRTVQIGSSFDYKGRTVSTNVAAVDFDYLKTFGVKMLAGRDFDKSFGTDTIDNVIVSESAAKQYNEKQLIGMHVGGDSTASRWHIIGIFPDFHLYSMQEEIQPLTLTLNNHDALNYCFIKVAPQNAVASMDAIKKEMASLEPSADFTGTFIDENINGWYQQEEILSILFSIAAGIAIVLSCTGLLAMVLLIIQQRTKEIGVRKILGASVSNLSLLISRDFLGLVMIAVLISTPIAWFVMGKWLQSFPYRITIQWWMFALVGLVAVIISLVTIGVNTVKAAMQNPVKSLRTE